jgi:toxin ParE1/3/4
MVQRVELTRAARDDLKDIGRFTHRQWGRTQRIKYMGEIERRIRDLADGPGRARLRSDIGPDIRSASVGRHVVFFRTTEIGILVLRVLHAQMDIERHLP